MSSSKNDAPCSLMQSAINCARGLICTGSVARGQGRPNRKRCRRGKQALIGVRAYRGSALLRHFCDHCGGRSRIPGDVAGQTTFVEPTAIVVGEVAR